MVCIVGIVYITERNEMEWNAADDVACHHKITYIDDGGRQRLLLLWRW